MPLAPVSYAYAVHTPETHYSMSSSPYVYHIASATTQQDGRLNSTCLHTADVIYYCDDLSASYTETHVVNVIKEKTVIYCRVRNGNFEVHFSGEQK